MRDFMGFIDQSVHEYYWEEDLNCATTVLKILAEIFEIDLSRQVIDAAIGMHGGGKFGAQCGLVEGPLMLIGILGKERGKENGEIVSACYHYAKSFQTTFGTLACKELRPQGFNPDNPPHLCEALTKRAAAFAVNYINNLKEWEV